MAPDLHDATHRPHPLHRTGLICALPGKNRAENTQHNLRYSYAISCLYCNLCNQKGLKPVNNTSREIFFVSIEIKLVNIF